MVDILYILDNFPGVLTSGFGGVILSKTEKKITNTMMKTSTYPQGSPRELPVGARQREPGCGIPFGVASLKSVGEDG